MGTCCASVMTALVLNHKHCFHKLILSKNFNGFHLRYIIEHDKVEFLKIILEQKFILRPNLMHPVFISHYHGKTLTYIIENNLFGDVTRIDHFRKKKQVYILNCFLPLFSSHVNFIISNFL